MAGLKTVIKIPAGLKPERKQELANALMNAIAIQAKNGIDKDGNPFPNYTPEYAKLKGSSDVDLTESGSMLDDLRVLKIGRDYVEIGYDGRTTNSKIAEGNILGSYGGKPDPSKARDFLGLTDEAIAEIFEGFNMAEDELLQQEWEDYLNGVLDNISDEELEKLKELYEN